MCTSTIHIFNTVKYPIQGTNESDKGPIAALVYFHALTSLPLRENYYYIDKKWSDYTAWFYTYKE